ncbi:MAG TPA: bifunctional DNA primase/polymerase [Gaiellales bacterium]|nr:bifunctional DNA primase/polymerase [Gaiellales bacterium]
MAVSHVDAAVELAGQGFRVFPLKPRGKTPLIKGGRGCLDATTDAEMVRAWWRGSPNANIGIATGDGLFVIDIDGDEAAAAFTRLIVDGDHDFPMQTPTALTGGHGFHYYLSLPPGVVLGNTAGRLADGVDTRATGGYVVAPPSVHPDGDGYHWVIAPVDTAVRECPAWLIDLLLRDDDESPGRRVAAMIADETSGIGSRILAAECARIAATPEGQRNHVAFARSAAVGNLVAGGLIALADAAARLTAAARESGLNTFEAEQAVMNGLERGIQTPRLIGDAERVS